MLERVSNTNFPKYVRTVHIYANDGKIYLS